MLFICCNISFQFSNSFCVVVFAVVFFFSVYLHDIFFLLLFHCSHLNMFSCFSLLLSLLCFYFLYTTYISIYEVVFNALALPVHSYFYVLLTVFIQFFSVVALLVFQIFSNILQMVSCGLCVCVMCMLSFVSNIYYNICICVSVFFSFLKFVVYIIHSK